MKVHLLPIAILILLINISFSFAQDENPLEPGQQSKPFYIGPTFGYNRSLHGVELQTIADPNVPCPSFTNGQSNGFWGGLTFEYHLGKIKDSKSSIILKVLYSTLPASLKKGGDQYPTLLDFANKDTIINSKTEHLSEVTYDLVSFEGFYKLNLFDSPFGVTIGFDIGYAMTRNFRQTMNLIEPLNAQFKINPNYEYINNNRTVIISDGEIDASTAFRFGMKVGIQYEINLKRVLFAPAVLVPVAYYNYGITNLVTNNDWRVNALQIGVDLRWAIK